MNSRTPFLLLASFLGFLPLVACSAAPDGGRTGTTQSSSTGGCAATLADYCSTTSCLTTWAAADDVCMSAEPGAANPVSFSTTCGDLYALSQGSTTSYFASDGLIAVVDAGGRCLAGPSDFAVPNPAACPLIACGMESCGEGGAP